MARISVIVPVYNCEEYLGKCIDSIQNSTFKDFQIICVNDGSTDNTDSLLREYKDKRIKYFKNKNQGIGKTRNFGIDKAKGKYLMFIDSDDYIEKDACEKLYERTQKEKLDLVVFDFYRVENNEIFIDYVVSEEDYQNGIDFTLKKDDFTLMINSVSFSNITYTFLDKIIHYNFILNKYAGKDIEAYLLTNEKLIYLNLNDFSYSDGGLSLTIDRQGNLDKYQQKLFDNYIRQLTNIKKCFTTMLDVNVIVTPTVNTVFAQYLGSLFPTTFGLWK